MNKNELNEILDKHKKWLEGNEGGIRANLYNAKGVLSFIGEKDLLVYFKYKDTYYFKIGCLTLEAKEWIKHYKDIGEDNGYTSSETELYGSVIKLFSQYDLEDA